MKYEPHPGQRPLGMVPAPRDYIVDDYGAVVGLVTETDLEAMQCGQVVVRCDHCDSVRRCPADVELGEVCSICSIGAYRLAGGKGR